jgi:thiaminase (transcriptional activator TenA)
MSRRPRLSPRRTNFDHPSLKALTFRDSPPPINSISWKLWLACQDIAQEALNTLYIQGIGEGNLNPDDYGQYTIEDCAYCFNAQNEYLITVNRAQADGYPELAAFAQARHDSYVKYTNELFAAWHLENPSALAPGPAAQLYINYEHYIACVAFPIYGVVDMIPCDQLWTWLATQLPTNPSNIYDFWITGNNDWTGAYRLDNFIDDWFSQYPDFYDFETALYVYRTSMTCELNFFKSACGQPLLTLPKTPSK